jgi:phosphate acetyltransferase
MSNPHEKYQRLIDYCKGLPPMPTAVVHPCDQSSLEGAVEAARLGLIAPILVGPRERIEAVARDNGISIGEFPIVDAPHSEAAAAAAVQLVREGKAEALREQPDRRWARWSGASRACVPGAASATVSSWMCRATRMR